MEYVYLILLCALVFGLCFLVDKGFKKLFRNRREHQSGLAVRHNKKVMAFGVIAIALGIAAFFSAGQGGLVFYIGGAVLILIGIVLITMYTTFGPFTVMILSWSVPLARKACLIPMQISVHRSCITIWVTF